MLHGRVTGADSLALIQDLLKGADASTNGAFTVVTDRLVTLGLPDRIVNALPLADIRFDEAVGEGPGTLFSEFLDLILDAEAFMVELGLAVIGAIAAFFGQAVKDSVQPVHVRTPRISRTTPGPKLSA